MLDCLAVALAFEVAALLRFDGIIPPDVTFYFLPALPVVVLIFIFAFLMCGIYWRAWQYAGLVDALLLSKAVLLGLAILLVVDIAVGMPLHKRPVPLSIALAGSAFALLAVGTLKLAPRIRRRLLQSRVTDSTERLLIFGAGEAGQWLVRELRNSSGQRFVPICFVDDDPKKVNLRVHGVPIVGTRDDIPAIVAQSKIDVVAVAIPSAPGPVVREVVEICQQTDAKVTIVPGVSEILDGTARGRPLREVTVEDLLGREPVRIDLDACRAYVSGKVVLLTGAAGSIGSELARQLFRLGPKKLVLLDSNESGLHDLALRLRSQGDEPDLAVAVCGVDRGDMLARVFGSHQPQLVFHAAAYKHVPLMEQYPQQAVLVNVVGTANVCRCAEEYGAERVVLISTDKAVNPVNVMGASKRICEELIRAYGRVGQSRRAEISVGSPAGDVLFTAVRFGNVLDSRGSVIPTFAWQIDQGGPVTVTHPEMRRYFMTIPEAASLVIQAGAYARSGDIFLLDMGEEMNISDLAQKMILMRGLRPGRDIQITFTGLRPGEKLREELTVGHESLQATPHAKINRVAARPAIDRERLLSAVEDLATVAVTGDTLLLRTRLFTLVEECEQTGHEGRMMMVLPRA